MSYEDYDQAEIDNMTATLLELHFLKLKPEELVFLSDVIGSRITDQARDVLVSMYDRMSESTY